MIIEARPPATFGLRAMLGMHIWGLVLAVPVVACVVVMSLMPIGFLPLLLPFIGVAISVALLPLGFGNPYVTMLVKRRMGPNGTTAGKFVVQAALTPRLRRGFWALFEDADDVGLLSVGSNAVIFEGDSLNACIPLQHVEAVTLRNIGVRGLFLYGQRVHLSLRGNPEYEAIEFAERASLLLPSSRKITRRIWESLNNQVQEARRSASTETPAG